MKKTKIIIPALAVLLLSTAASVSGTVAWFSMNNSVSVNGMAVQTKVSTNLQISESDDVYGDSLEQSREGFLQPASTTDGESFFYAPGEDSGAANANFVAYSEAPDAENNPTNAFNNVSAGKEYYDAAFNTLYQYAQDTNDADTFCYGYIDYTFYLKLGSVVSGQKLSLTKCELKYDEHGADPTNSISANNGHVTTGFAWRVGVFAAEKEGNSDPSSLNLVTILGLEGAKNQNQKNTKVTNLTVDTENPENSSSVEDYYTYEDCAAEHKCPSGAKAQANTTYWQKHSDDDPLAVVADGDYTDASNKDEVENAGEEANLATYSANAAAKKYKVVVRLWLEGEDVSCTSDTYAALTEEWKLDLEFKLGINGAASSATEHAYDGVEYISTPAAA